ncbi:hypothetical protein [Rubritalea tangerina]|uniref:hypothetical protein n=1 Tax=Rubritalea tangerina TaxID=430798 RepID=UPI003608DFEF
MVSCGSRVASCWVWFSFLPLASSEKVKLVHFVYSHSNQNVNHLIRKLNDRSLNIHHQ